MFTANVLRVMIASPGDVKEERDIVTREIYRWNDAHAMSRKLVLQPVKWETHSTPQMGAPPQEVLDEQLVYDADILVGIFGTRIGTPTESHISGTVEEIKRHVGAGKTAKVYFSDAPVPPSKIDPQQYQALQEFKEECRQGGLYATYDNLDSFRETFPQHLAIELNSPRYLWIVAPISQAKSSQGSSISEQAGTALIAASDAEGDIIYSSTMSGESVTAGKETLTDGTVRSAAIWKEVLNELESERLIKQTAYDSGIYRLTGAGYRLADSLRTNQEEKKQLEIELRVEGTASSQSLHVQSNKKIKLRQIELLTSAGVSVANEDIDLDVDDEPRTIQLDHSKVIKLFNSSRPDMSLRDGSGPALIRLTFAQNGTTQSVDLPVMIQPVFVNAGSGSTQYTNLSGNKRFYF